MNYRKDIFEKVNFMLKDNSNVNINCSKLARQYGCDRRTVSKACIAYRPETKGKVEVTAKLVNRLKVYSGDITCFDDIRRMAAELNEQINSEKCQATDKPRLNYLSLRNHI